MQIYINNTPVPFDKISLSLALRSPLFNEADGSYIYNFTMPATSELKKALGFAHRINTPRTTEADFMLQQGSVFIKGTAIVSRADDNNYEIAVGVGKGDFNYKIKDKLLTDNMFSWDEVDILQIALGNNVNSYTYNDSQNVPFSYSYALYYPTIIRNDYNGFNVNASQYTALYTQVYIFKFNLPIINSSIYNTWWGTFHIKKNGVSIYSESHESGKIVRKTLSLNAGDIITYSIDFDSIQTEFTPDVFEVKVWFDSIGELEIIESKNADFFNSINSFYPETKYVIFPTYNKNFFDNLKNDNLKNLYNNNVYVQNYFNSPEFPLDVTYFVFIPGTGVVANSLSNIFVPYLYVGYIIDNIINTLGYSIKNNIFRNSEWKQLVLFNTFAENDYKVDDVSGNLRVVANVKSELKNHLIPMKISDFLNGICMQTAHIILVNNESKEIEFVSVDEIIKSVKTTDFNQNAEAYQKEMDNLFNGFRLKYNTQDDKYIDDNYEDLAKVNYKGETSDLDTIPNPQINDCYKLTTTSVNNMDRDYYVWKYDTTANILKWVKYSKDFGFYIEEKSENVYEKTTDLCPIMITNQYDYFSNYPQSGKQWILPVSGQPGKFKFGYETLDSNNMPSLLMYRGMQPDSDNINYPLATNHTDRFLNTHISGANISLRMDTQYGLYERWKAFLQYIISCKKLNIEKQLSEKEFKDLMFSQKYRMFHKNILLNEVKIKITDKTIETEEITGFTD